MSTVVAFKVQDEQWTQEFDEAFREHAPMIYRTAYSVTRSAQDAEDVVQSLFLVLLRKGFPEGMRINPKGYLYRSAVNLSINAVRRRARHVPIADATSERLAAPSTDTEESHAELQRRLAEAMTQLNPSDVELLVLRYEHEYTDAQIAKLMGRPRASVAVALFRARARLRKLLS
jgi:RNA polymerase sigma-70 factor (ECF subfamily)